MNTNKTETGEGYITVRVTTARGAIPLSGAGVTVRNSDRILYSFVSDSAGLTPRMALSAPPRALSEEPGNIRPYSLYIIEISYPGYYGQTFDNVPIFDGVDGLQTVELTALPANSLTERENPENERHTDSDVYEL